MLRLLAIFILGTAPFLAVVHAQVVDVTLSPSSPPETSWGPGPPANHPIAAFRFFASGGASQLDGLTLTTSGTGDFASDLAAGDGLQAWRDDGDGVFNESNDTQLAAIPGSSPTAAMTFSSTVTIADGTSEDIWIIGSFLANNKDDKNYAVSIANAGDVDVGSSTVTMGTPSPISELIWIIAAKGSDKKQGQCSTAEESDLGATLVAALLSVFCLRVVYAKYVKALDPVKRSP